MVIIIVDYVHFKGGNVKMYNSNCYASKNFRYTAHKEPGHVWDGDAVYASTMAKIDRAIIDAKAEGEDQAVNSFLFRTAAVFNWIPPLWGLWPWLYTQAARYFIGVHKYTSNLDRVDLLAADVKEAVIEHLTSA